MLLDYFFFHRKSFLSKETCHAWVEHILYRICEKDVKADARRMNRNEVTRKDFSKKKLNVTVKGMPRVAKRSLDFAPSTRWVNLRGNTNMPTFSAA